VTGSFTAAPIRVRRDGGSVDHWPVAEWRRSARMTSRCRAARRVSPNKNVGSDKTVTASGFSLEGDDKANYALGTIGTATASITKRSVTGSFTAADKVYDGTAAASITGPVAEWRARRG
jgi:hypothetical protein